MTRYDVRLQDGTVQSFFEERATGSNADQLIEAHWVSETSLYRFIPEYLPRPVAFGSYKTRPDTHFFLLEWVDMIEEDGDENNIPSPEAYVAPIAALHLRSEGKPPTGMFGFSVKTRFGDLSQSIDWEASWEVWWTKHMKFVVAREEKIKGPHTPENEVVVQNFLNLVLPRYLGPLESEGRKVEPTLCHTDCWPGNIKYIKGNKSVVICDANALWCHNEVELAPLYNPRYPLGQRYTNEYWKHVAISEPKEDADSRITMYLVRNQVCLAIIYPNEDGDKLREVYLATMRILVDKVLDEMEVSTQASGYTSPNCGGEAVPEIPVVYS